MAWLRFWPGIVINILRRRKRDFQPSTSGQVRRAKSIVQPREYHCFHHICKYTAGFTAIPQGTFYYPGRKFRSVLGLLARKRAYLIAFPH